MVEGSDKESVQTAKDRMSQIAMRAYEGEDVMLAEVMSSINH